jgi:hypothetical protein
MDDRDREAPTGQDPHDYYLMSRFERGLAVRAAMHAQVMQKGRLDLTMAAGYMAVGSLWLAAAGVMFLGAFVLVWLGSSGGAIAQWILRALGTIALAAGGARWLQYRRLMTARRRESAE